MEPEAEATAKSEPHGQGSINVLGYRRYDDGPLQEQVERTYRLMLENQTPEYVAKTKKLYFSGPFAPTGLWDAMELLNAIVDESDPDVDLPQIVHAYQTGESIRSRYLLPCQDDGKSGAAAFSLRKDVRIRSFFSDDEWADLSDERRKAFDCNLHQFYSDIAEWDWFPLVGFIHDLGKIIITERFGGREQWSAVGDTFPLGVKLDPNFVFFDKGYHVRNEGVTVTSNEPNCGFDSLHFSFGHDEYLASALERLGAECSIPDLGVYLVRYHSFYSWHTPRNSIRGYTAFASEKDWKCLPLLKAFQKADLYSKTRVIPSVDQVKATYGDLAKKYGVETFQL